MFLSLSVSLCLSDYLFLPLSSLPPALNDAGLKESRAYSFVLAALRTHHYDISVQSSGLLALANMLKTGERYK